MRNVLLICICLAAAYCVDRNYYGGAFTHSFVQRLYEVGASYEWVRLSEVASDLRHHSPR